MFGPLQILKKLQTNQDMIIHLYKTSDMYTIYLKANNKFIKN